MHRRILTVLAAVLLALGLGTAPALAGTGSAEADDPVAYLALGDSYGAGYQPRAGDDLAGGYAGPVLDAFATLAPGARLTNLSCGGETIESYRDGGRFCDYAGSQREAALAFLAEHPETRLVTISLGGNNVQTCVSRSGAVDFTCLQDGMGTIRAEMPRLLAELRAAAPRAQIVVTNYPDVFLAAWLTGPAGQDLARLSVNLIDNLNSIYDGAATSAGVDLADVSDAFGTSDFTMVEDPTYGQIPANVAAVCSLTWMCLERDIHPNDEGYALIASVVSAMLREPSAPDPSGSPSPSPSGSTSTDPSPSGTDATSPSTTTITPTSGSPADGPQTPALVQTDSGAPGAGVGPAVLAVLGLAGLLFGAAAARRRAAARH